MHLETIELRHTLFPAPVRVVSDNESLAATLETDAPVDPLTEVTFVPMSFELTLPEKGTGPDPRLQIGLDNVSGLLTPYLQAATESDTPIAMTYRAFLYDPIADTVTGPDGIIHLEVVNVNANSSAVIISAAIPNPANLAFPNDLITTERFPGLVS